MIDDQFMAQLVDRHDPTVKWVMLGLRLSAAVKPSKSQHADQGGKGKVPKKMGSVHMSANDHYETYTLSRGRSRWDSRGAVHRTARTVERVAPAKVTDL